MEWPTARSLENGSKSCSEMKHMPTTSDTRCLSIKPGRRMACFLSIIPVGGNASIYCGLAGLREIADHDRVSDEWLNEIIPVEEVTML